MTRRRAQPKLTVRKDQSTASTKMVIYGLCQMCGIAKHPDFDEFCAECVAGCEERARAVQADRIAISRELGERPEPREPGPRWTFAAAVHRVGVGVEFR